MKRFLLVLVLLFIPFCSQRNDKQDRERELLLALFLAQNTSVRPRTISSLILEEKLG